jgi:hypothetical protein
LVRQTRRNRPAVDRQCRRQKSEIRRFKKIPISSADGRAHTSAMQVPFQCAIMAFKNTGNHTLPMLTVAPRRSRGLP